MVLVSCKVRREILKNGSSYELILYYRLRVKILNIRDINCFASGFTNEQGGDLLKLCQMFMDNR